MIDIQSLVEFLLPGMPITKQAAKKLRRDRTTHIRNARVRRDVRETVKAVRKHPTLKMLSAASKILHKAAKTNVIHKNKAARLKSRLSKLLGKK